MASRPIPLSICHLVFVAILKAIILKGVYFIILKANVVKGVSIKVL